MKPASLTLRMLMVFCAMNMLIAQMMGVHFHRHLAGLTDHGVDHGVSLHLRDAGMHLHEDAAHHAMSDRAAHPDEDLEIDPLGTGLAKFAKVWLAPALIFALALCLLVVARVPAARFEPHRRRHPALFFLRPPSNAPPSEPSHA